MAIGHRSKPFSSPVMMVLALALGLLIAFADSSPGWDSTGITAGALLVVGGTTALIGRTRPWMWASLVGLPTPVIGITRDGQTGSLLALVFAGIGAAIGWTAARVR